MTRAAAPTRPASHANDQWEVDELLQLVLPRLCGAPPSISCAVRACSNGRTVPTRAVNLPRSNKSLIVSSRAVVTCARKELIINSAGKNMSPVNIEQKLKASSPLIEQAICIGDGRPYNVA